MSAMTVSNMQFCPTCGNLLLVEQSATFRFFCQTCPYVHNINSAISRKVPLQRKEVDDVLGGQEAWKNAEQTSTALCPKCSGTKAFFFSLQTRSADEPMTIMYRCSNHDCAHRWNEN